MARIRCRNSKQENYYWRKEEERKCILCGKEKENMKHTIMEYEATRDEFQIANKFVHEIIRLLTEEKRNKEITKVWRMVKRN